jgi:outer membrane murein-binding lipoprotein Lpp
MKKQIIITLTAIAAVLMAAILAGCVDEDSFTLNGAPVTESNISTDNGTLGIGAFNI